ncbi:zinc finger FYVE/PHD-type [Rhizopogon vesiculosus]|uniref:Zinc finger FYVE/PHD-type n=1 Tax=Rhizopogon vesiculosus TaxID=180088 RepID=A0A1J8QPP1_9AGAM|nr:zinc finger FYVE/PHD-type [Rhizopogon vesiculosus]
MTLGYTVSQEDPSVISTFFIHFRLYKEAHTRFTVVFHDIPGMNSQIEDKVQDLCIPIPLELVPCMIEIYEFVSVLLSCGVSSADEYMVARVLWKRVQAKKFHERILPQKAVPNDASESFS